MSDVQSHIQQVETGLHSQLEPAEFSERSYSLAERMAEYRVPGVSIAVINGASSMGERLRRARGGRRRRGRY